METFFLQKSLPSLRGKKIFPFSPGLSNLACASNYDLQREKRREMDPRGEIYLTLKGTTSLQS